VSSQYNGKYNLVERAQHVLPTRGWLIQRPVTGQRFPNTGAARSNGSVKNRKPKLKPKLKRKPKPKRAPPATVGIAREGTKQVLIRCATGLLMFGPVFWLAYKNQVVASAVAASLGTLIARLVGK